MDFERVTKIVFNELILYNFIFVDRETTEWAEKRRVIFLGELGEVVVACLVESMSFIA